MKTINLRQLFYFTEVVRANSIRGAARALCVSPSVVSAAMKDLEFEVGEPLFLRTGNQSQLTPRGRELHRHAEKMVAHAQAALDPDSRKTSGKVTVTTTVSNGVAELLLPDFLSFYEEELSDIEFNVVADDAVLDLEKAGVDMALRNFFLDDPSTSENTLDNYVLKLWAAPEVAERLDDLKPGGDQAIDFIGLPVQVARGVSVRDEDGTGSGMLPINTVTTVNSTLIARQLAVSGRGVILSTPNLLLNDMVHGRLVPIGERYVYGYMSLTLIFASDKPTAEQQRIGSLVRSYGEARKELFKSLEDHAKPSFSMAKED